ncbi:MAG: addiction module toxin RelE [archaeon]
MSYIAIILEDLKKILNKLATKDKVLSTAVYNKIEQICSCDEDMIEQHYKNLKYEFSDYKRVHVTKSFVLLFNVDKKDKKIYFFRLDHHDKIYNR